MKSSIIYSLFPSLSGYKLLSLFLLLQVMRDLLYVYRQKIQFNGKTKGSSFYERNIIQLQDLMSFAQQNTSVSNLATKGQISQQTYHKCCYLSKGITEYYNKSHFTVFPTHVRQPRRNNLSLGEDSPKNLF